MKILVTVCCLMVTGFVFARAWDSPTAECLQYVMANNRGNLSMASAICKGGVNPECLAFIQANRPNTNISSAGNMCKGGVERECLEYAMNSSEHDRSVTSVAKFCTDWVSADCLRFMVEELKKDLGSAHNLCSGGVEVACLRYILSLGKSLTVARGMCTP